MTSRRRYVAAVIAIAAVGGAIAGLALRDRHAPALNSAMDHSAGGREADPLDVLVAPLAESGPPYELFAYAAEFARLDSPALLAALHSRLGQGRTPAQNFARQVITDRLAELRRDFDQHSLPEPDLAAAPSAAGSLADDPAAIASRVFAPGFELRHDQISAIARDLARTDPPAAIRWISESITDPKLRLQAARDVLHHLARGAPEVAADFLATDVTFPARDHVGLAETFVAAWSEADPPTALAWALSQEGDLRKGSLQAYFRTPDARAFALLESAAIDDAERASLLRNATHLATIDLPRYLSLVAEMPDAKAATSTLANTAAALARDGNFGEATSVIDALLSEGEAAVVSPAQVVVAQFARADPAAAAEWLDTFPDGDARTYGVRNLLDTWARSDPAAAARYAQDLPPGSPEHQQAAVAMAERILAHDPAGALAWYAKFENSNLRYEFLTHHIDALLVLAPDEADRLTRDAGEGVLAKRDKAIALREFLLRHREP
ncbi:hypothetical protein BH23VER1_BH23VER1_19910 [soil metagenome]